MIRKIIHISEEKCSGCGLCATACHEGAIGMVRGKARLLRDDYCDGLGDCLPACPEGAISFVEREAAAYDEKAVAAHMRRRAAGGCPGEKPRSMVTGCPGEQVRPMSTAQSEGSAPAPAPSRLAQWPCQIKLAPVNAPFFAGAELLIAADCTAYAYAGIHEEFMKGRVTLVGCPKLDSVDYSEKLTEILRENSIRSVLLLRMEVPCCGGMKLALEKARSRSGKSLPLEVVTLSVDGKILRRESL